MFGFINLDKPPGFTSHDCVAKLRRILNTKKIGHGGTLDPAATGVLPIAVGKATRLLQFLPQPKAYRARIRFGITTKTDDLEGEIIKTASAIALDRSQIDACLPHFIGTIEQVPPIYSAIKKGGKKLYELARKGEEIKIEPRKITISDLQTIDFFPGEFPEIEVDIYCSPGTYIRAIARDLGEMLGVGGTLANLIRTESCGMKLENSYSFERIETEIQENKFCFIEPTEVLDRLKSIYLNDDVARRWCYGQKIPISEREYEKSSKILEDGDFAATFAKDNLFLGISILIDVENELKIKPKIVLQ